MSKKMTVTNVLDLLEKSTTNELELIGETVEETLEELGQEIPKDYIEGFIAGQQGAKISIINKIRMTRNIYEIEKATDVK